MTEPTAVTGIGEAVLRIPVVELVEVPLLDLPHRDDACDRKTP